MGCDDPINQTEHISFNLKEDTDADPLLQALDEDKQVIDITGYTFDSRFLDEEGGTILEEPPADIVDAVNGIFRPFFMNEATNNALISLAAPPTFWEFFATKDGARHKWLTADVGIEPAGSDA